MTDGGTTSGYSETGSACTEIRPAMKMSSESTPAKTGRSMKNFETFMAKLRGRSGALGRLVTPRHFGRGGRRWRHRHLLRRHQRASAYALQAADHHALA